MTGTARIWPGRTPGIARIRLFAAIPAKAESIAGSHQDPRFRGNRSRLRLAYGNSFFSIAALSAPL